MIALIKNSTETAVANGTGAINTTANRNLQQFVFQGTGIGDQYAPTARLDYNLTDNHRITGTGYVQRFVSTADLLNNRDPNFPGMPNYASQNSWRTTGSLGVRSTLGSSMVNEFKVGFQPFATKWLGNSSPGLQSGVAF